MAFAVLLLVWFMSGVTGSVLSASYHSLVWHCSKQFKAMVCLNSQLLCSRSLLVYLISLVNYTW